MKTGLLIICIGNPLRGDDGVAHVLGEQLVHCKFAAGAKIRHVHQLLPEHSLWLRSVDTVVFIDAAVDILPGQFSCRNIGASAAGQSPVSHSFQPQTLLAMAQLYNTAPDAWQLTIGARQFDTPHQLSPEVLAAIPDAIEALRQFIPQPAF